MEKHTKQEKKTMDPKKFLKPKEVEINGRKFVISKIPAIPAKEVYASIMKECKDDGDIAMTYLSTEARLNLLTYAAAVDGEEWIGLSDPQKINFYCEDINTLNVLEAMMIRYNYSFLFDGSLQKVLEVLRDISPDTSSPA